MTGKRKLTWVQSDQRSESIRSSNAQRAAEARMWWPLPDCSFFFTTPPSVTGCLSTVCQRSILLSKNYKLLKSFKKWSILFFVSKLTIFSSKKSKYLQDSWFARFRQNSIFWTKIWLLTQCELLGNPILFRFQCAFLKYKDQIRLRIKERTKTSRLKCFMPKIIEKIKLPCY